MLLLIACAAQPDGGADGAGGLAPTITVDPRIGAAATVTWTTETAGDARVEVTGSDGSTRTITGETSEDGREHTALLAGLAGGYDWTWRAVSETEDGEIASEEAVFTPAAPPLKLGAFAVTDGDPSALDSTQVLTTMLGGSPAAVLLDGEGRITWWYEAPASSFPSNARISADGKAVLILASGLPNSDFQSEILRIPFDGSEPQTTSAPSGHHDLFEFPDGGYAFLAEDSREFDGERVAGDALMEVDAAGEMRTVWSTWDDLTPTDVATMELLNGARDWTHCNGIAFDADSGTYLVSSHNLSAIFAIDRATGDVRWQAGGAGSTLALTSGAGFEDQHGPTLVPGGFLVFDNRPEDPASFYSDAVEYRVDEAAGGYAEQWRFDAGKTMHTTYNGTVERLPDGATLIGWGSAGRIQVVADQTVTWQLDGPIGGAFGFTHAVPSLAGSP